jgi:hypothetical protein
MLDYFLCVYIRLDGRLGWHSSFRCLLSSGIRRIWFAIVVCVFFLLAGQITTLAKWRKTSQGLFPTTFFLFSAGSVVLNIFFP